jgi:SAM-dependent methyltransferase
MNAPVLRSPRCGSCGHAMQVFFELPAVPVNSCLLVDSRPAALAFKRGDIALGFCNRCGFVSNVAFCRELTEYSGRYEETQGYSETFNRFHRALAEDLVERLDLRGKRIIEIGCGKGEFLSLICRMGANSGVGFDPAFDDSRNILGDVDAHVRKELFGESSGREDGDFVCCKMTLEHIPDTAQFVRAARRALRPLPGSMAFFQVPESMRILRECALEDVYYEHCSYFTAGSLARLFRGEGFDVRRIGVAYAGQYLTIEATLTEARSSPTLAVEESVEEAASSVATFTQRFIAKSRYWGDFVQSRASQGSVLLWGSGSKAVAFLRAVESAEAIEHVVDINPYRQGHYMPGTGQQIVGPQHVAKLEPRVVIAMNSMYRDEIAAELQRRGVQTELVTL